MDGMMQIVKISGGSPPRASLHPISKREKIFQRKKCMQMAI